jgi:hypothetical protein
MVNRWYCPERLTAVSENKPETADCWQSRWRFKGVSARSNDPPLILTALYRRSRRSNSRSICSSCASRAATRILIVDSSQPTSCHSVRSSSVVISGDASLIRAPTIWWRARATNVSVSDGSGCTHCSAGAPRLDNISTTAGRNAGDRLLELTRGNRRTVPARSVDQVQSHSSLTWLHVADAHAVTFIVQNLRIFQSDGFLHRNEGALSRSASFANPAAIVVSRVAISSRSENMKMAPKATGQVHHFPSGVRTPTQASRT